MNDLNNRQVMCSTLDAHWPLDSSLAPRKLLTFFFGPFVSAKPTRTCLFGILAVRVRYMCGGGAAHGVLKRLAFCEIGACNCV